VVSSFNERCPSQQELAGIGEWLISLSPCFFFPRFFSFGRHVFHDGGAFGSRPRVLFHAGTRPFPPEGTDPFFPLSSVTPSCRLVKVPPYFVDFPPSPFSPSSNPLVFCVIMAFPNQRSRFGSPRHRQFPPFRIFSPFSNFPPCTPVRVFLRPATIGPFTGKKRPTRQTRRVSPRLNSREGCIELANHTLSQTCPGAARSDSPPTTFLQPCSPHFAAV